MVNTIVSQLHLSLVVVARSNVIILHMPYSAFYAFLLQSADATGQVL